VANAKFRPDQITHQKAEAFCGGGGGGGGRRDIQLSVSRSCDVEVNEFIY
jgi:hypothetical protein